MTVYGYTRVSTQQQTDSGHGLQSQARQIQGYCMMQGLEAPQMIVEAGVSGSVPLSSRPEGEALLGALRKGDTLIASKLDRMFRSALDALQSVELFKKRGISLVLLDLGGDVTGSGLSKFFLTMTAAFAEMERDRISERATDTKQKQRAAGKFLGGKVPYGFSVKDGLLVEDEAQQAVIQRVKQLSSLGVSYRGIMARLHEETGSSLALNTVMKLVKGL